MENYLKVIFTAFLLFPLLAFVITVPYLFYQYKKFGSIPLLRSVIIYSFVLYCLTCYFLVILPLPSISQVEKLTTPYYNLIPAKSLLSLFQSSSFDASSFSSYLSILRSFSMQEIFFNTCFLFPLGIYMRYYFQRNAKQTVLLGFFVSLFFELTQLSGLYGIYPRPYRLFDITDLIDNTLGCYLGYLCTPLFCFFLPTRQKLDTYAYICSQKVPLLRRLLASILDWAALLVLLIAGESILFQFFPALKFLRTYRFPLLITAVILYFCFFQWVCKGLTLGKAFFHLKLVTTEQKNPSLSQYFIRYLLLYAVILPSPFYLYQTFIKYPPFANNESFLFSNMLWIFNVVIIFSFLVESIIKLVGFSHEYWYEQLSHTQVISTLAIPKSENLHENYLKL